VNGHASDLFEYYAFLEVIPLRILGRELTEGFEFAPILHVKCNLSQALIAPISNRQSLDSSKKSNGSWNKTVGANQPIAFPVPLPVAVGKPLH